MASSDEEHLLYVCYATQSGTAESFCDKFQKELWKEHKLFARKVDLDYFDVVIQLKQKIVLLILYATYGEGGPTDNARDFHDFVMKNNEPHLGNIRYAVFGLGDSLHPIFCSAGILLDGRLEERGAKRIVKLVKRDEQAHARKSETEYEQWKAELIPILKTFKWKEHPDQQEEIDSINGITKVVEGQKKGTDKMLLLSVAFCVLVVLYQLLVA